MEFVRSFLRRHVEGKPVVASPNVGCFFRLASSDLCFLFTGISWLNIHLGGIQE